MGDWRSPRLLTDVPPSSLKGLLTHFDYSGPVVTENITSIRTIKWAALFFSSVPHVVPLESLPLPWDGLTQSNLLITVLEILKNGLAHY